MKKVVATRDGGVEVDLTPQEILDREADMAASEIERVREEAQRQTKLARKRSALQKLRASGLSREEIKALFDFDLPD